VDHCGTPKEYEEEALMPTAKRTVRKTSVVVIGGAGFLGSHLVKHLIEDRGCKVLVLDNLISGRREFIHPDATFQWFDITSSEDSLLHVFQENPAEYVFNYAAEPYVPLSIKRPLHVFNINAFAVLKVLNAAQEAGVKAILQVSSAEIYGDTHGKIKESDYVIPHSSYGVSKVAADGFVQVRWKEAGTPVIALRQFNCVGENETHPYVIPEIIKQLMAPWPEGQTRMVRLGNNSFRDFQYAGDAVRMAVELLEKGEFGEVYNMGSEEGIQIYDLAELIGKLMNVDVQVIPDKSRMRPWEIWHLQSDNSKLYSAIDTRPEVSLTEALRCTIKWFQNNPMKF